MPENQIEYFVSYFIRVNDDPGFGFGANVVTRSTPITSVEDVAEMAREIAERSKQDIEVSIINWRRFEQPDSL
jgi:hypothetical protein